MGMKRRPDDAKEKKKTSGERTLLGRKTGSPKPQPRPIEEDAVISLEGVRSANEAARHFEHVGIDFLVNV